MALKQLKISQSVTNRSEASIQKYFDEVAHIPTLSVEEEAKYAHLAKNAKTERERVSARNVLVRSNLRFVVSCAKQYQGKGLNLTDLIQEGNIGLIKASEAFDETKGFKFISYAVWWIRQQIMQFMSEYGKQIRMPQNKVAMLQAINKAQSQFFAEYGTNASLDDLHYLTGLDEEEIEKVLGESQCQNTTSMDAPISDDSDSSFESIFNGGGDATDKALDEESVSKALNMALATLNEREQYAIKHTIGFGCPKLSRSEIAEDLNLTQERVRQIVTNGLKKLRVRNGDQLKKFLL